MGTFFPVRPRIAARGEPLRNQCINKRVDMLSRFVRHPFVKAADLIKEFIYGVLPIKLFPQVSAGGVQAKTTETKTGIGVEENGPIVKLLPEHDYRVGYRFFIVLHANILLLPIPIAQNSALLD